MAAGAPVQKCTDSFSGPAYHAEENTRVRPRLVAGSPPDVVPACESMIGTKLSHYTISDRLGEGGMGVVYRAVDSRLNRTVALKVIASREVTDPDRKRRFVREARAASALNHPNIVTIHEIDEADGVDFLVMELVTGQTLERLIPEGGLPVARALAYGVAIAAALEAAHAAGIVHRDIKPANVMVTDSGQVKVLDFGIAKLLDRIADAGASTVAVTAATEVGVTIGTLRYMSPEQAQGQPVDTRSDVFSFGAVLYEMLAGRPAFAGDNTLATLAALLGEPAPLETRRRDVPADLAELVRRCLAKDRAARPTAADVVQQLTRIRDCAAAPLDLSQIVRRPAVLIPLTIVLVAMTAGGVWSWRTSARARWARNVAVPEIQRLVDRDDYDGAFRLAREAIAVLPDDPRLKQLWLDITFVASIESKPPGAAVAMKGYLSPDASWIPIGRTPLENVRVPFGALRASVTSDGFAPVETSGGGGRFRYTLDPPAAVPPGMVRVLGSLSTIEGSSVRLEDYWIDKFEVTNRQYKVFVDRGGYRTRSYWNEPFVSSGRTLSWDEAMAAFRDGTGRPGPSTWELGTYPEGQAEYPVTGVSWYEAVAYAAFAGKSLPTAFHWRGAAGYGDLLADILTISNFSLKGPAAGGSYKGLGPFGTYDMAGNATEWCLNEAAATGRRFILGGGWNEPSYSFRDLDAEPPFDRLPASGFRCVKYIKPPPAAALAPITSRSRDYTKDTPVGAEIFEVYRTLYRYDPGLPLNTTVEATEDAPAWTRDTITFDAAYGKERVRAYLYLPKNAPKPYQTVVYFPGSDAMILRTSHDLRLHFVDFLIRSGRAVLYPVYKGTYERGPVEVTGPSGWRDLTIARSKDLGRSIDYLATRPDIDSARLGYYGISAGATLGVLLTAIEPRFKASVLLSGGLDPVHPPPETDIWNFAPRVRVPTLMFNGGNDFSYPNDTALLPLFRMLGTPAGQKRQAVFEGGHIPVRIHDVIKEILDWFDRYLGPMAPA
jgi:eukaryotic-like serine/threonine-protein kinase